MTIPAQLYTSKPRPCLDFKGTLGALKSTNMITLAEAGFKKIKINRS